MWYANFLCGFFRLYDFVSLSHFLPVSVRVSWKIAKIKTINYLYFLGSPVALGLLWVIAYIMELHIVIYGIKL